jgi:hypothetical protein
MLEIAEMRRAWPQFTLKKIRGVWKCLELLSYYGNRRQVTKLLWRSSFRHRQILIAIELNMLKTHTVMETKLKKKMRIREIDVSR